MIEQKSKSPLALMEQAIMILVFAFAAALCMQAFVKADSMSKKLAERDRAVNICQTVAETVKAQNGNLERAAELLGGSAAGELLLYYNGEWNVVKETEAVYALRLVCKECTPYLTQSEITVTVVENGEVLFGLPVSWQEVSHE